MVARSQYFKLGFDTSDLIELADSIQGLDQQTLGDLRDSTVNTVSLRARETAVDKTFNYLNLTRDYIETKLDRMTSKGGKGHAAVRSDVRGTTLQRYGMRQEVDPVKWNNAEILSITKKKAFNNGIAYGPWATLPNGQYSNRWTERTGDRYGPRNIAPNDKQAGIAVSIYRGKAPVLFKHGFSVKLENDNGYGVFSWHKDQTSGSPHHKYGPSVYQTFRHYIKTDAEQISQDLLDEFNAGLDRILKGMT